MYNQKIYIYIIFKKFIITKFLVYTLYYNFINFAFDLKIVINIHQSYIFPFQIYLYILF